MFPRECRPRRQATRGDVPHHHLQWNDLHLANELLAHVQATDEMGGNADIGQPHHEVFADAVVQHALAGDHPFLLGVERGGVVLEVLHQGAGFRPLEQDLGFPFVELAAASHHDPFLGAHANPAVQAGLAHWI